VLRCNSRPDRERAGGGIAIVDVPLINALPGPGARLGQGEASRLPDGRKAPHGADMLRAETVGVPGVRGAATGRRGRAGGHGAF